MLSKGGNPGTDKFPRDPQTANAPYFGPNNWHIRPLSPTAFAINGTYRLILLQSYIHRSNWEKKDKH